MKLAIDERRGVYYIGWYDPEDGDFGCYLGDQVKDAEHQAAEDAVEGTADGRDSLGVFWDSRRAAQMALKRAKLAIASLERPLPAWAKTAMAEGWKPPRGWKAAARKGGVE